MKEKTAYQMVITNIATYLRSPENVKAVEKQDGSGINAFTCSTVLAIAFCKSKEQVIMDIVNEKI